MWLIRVVGGQREVVDGVETVLGEPFESKNASLYEDGRFKKAVKPGAKKGEGDA